MLFKLRLTIAVLLVAAIHLAFWITRSGALPKQVELPKPDLRSLPMQLGEWTGKEAELDPRIVKSAGAEYAVNRLYRRSDGQTVMLHIAVITNYGANGLHHFPQYCYRGSGYKLLTIERRQLQADDGDEIPTSFSLWARDHQRAAVVYWYRFGDDVVFDIDEFRRAQRKRWGSRVWPPVVKVLLQTPADRSDRTPPHLEEFAKLVAGWTCALSDSEN